MKILVFGGQKSGKTAFAIQKALELDTKPLYIATYDNSFSDSEMLQRVKRHKQERKENFTTLEAPLKLHKLQERKTNLIDCISMWIFNMLMKDFTDEKILKRVDKLLALDGNFIFVLNDTNSGVIPIDKLSRRFVDLTGIIGQKLGQSCDEVYEMKFGLQQRLK